MPPISTRRWTGIGLFVMPPVGHGKRCSFHVQDRLGRLRKWRDDPSADPDKCSSSKYSTGQLSSSIFRRTFLSSTLSNISWEAWKMRELSNFCAHACADLCAGSKKALRRMRRRRSTLVWSCWGQTGFFDVSMFCRPQYCEANPERPDTLRVAAVSSEQRPRHLCGAPDRTSRRSLRRAPKE